MIIRGIKISILLILISCFSTEVNQEPQQLPVEEKIVNNKKPISNDSILEEIENIAQKDTIPELKRFRMYYKRVIQPIIYSKKALIYAAPDTSSQVIKTVFFNSPVIPVLDSDIREWAQVLNGNDTVFVKSNDVAWYSFPDLNEGAFIYFISEKMNTATIHKYKIDEKKVIAEFELPVIPDDAEYINASNWKNVDLLVSLNYSGNCGGCPELQYYVIDANDEFEIIFETAQYIDDGEDEAGSESSVYFPENPETMDIIYSESEYGYEESNRSLTRRFRWDGVRLIQKEDTANNHR